MLLRDTQHFFPPSFLPFCRIFRVPGFPRGIKCTNHTDLEGLRTPTCFPKFCFLCWIAVTGDLSASVRGCLTSATSHSTLITICVAVGSLVAGMTSSASTRRARTEETQTKWSLSLFSVPARLLHARSSFNEPVAAP